MPVYHLNPRGFKSVRRKLILRSVLLQLPLVSGAVLGSIWYQSQGEADLLKFSLYLVPATVALIGFLLWRTLMKYRNIWDTYELSLFGGEVTRSQGTTPAATYDLKNDLISMNENTKGMLMLRFKEPDLLLVIPETIDDRDDLIERLQAFGEIGTMDEYGKLVRFSWLLQLLTLAAFAVFYMYDTKWIVGVSGTLLLAYLLYVVINRQRSTVASAAQKRKSLIYLVFVAMVGYRLLTVLW